MMHRAHVPLLVGTDAMNPFALPGFSVHEELTLLVDAGLTPLRGVSGGHALAGSIPSTPPIRSGTIDRGKVADLVFL